MQLMNPVIEIVGNILSSFFILTAAFGAIKHRRDLFLFGICFFCTVPIVGEGMAYAQDNNMLHLAVAMMFLAQVILTLPLNLRYDDENKTAMALSKRIGYAIYATNLFTGYLVLNNILDVPHQFGYMHLVVSLIMLYSIIRPIKKI